MSFNRVDVSGNSIYINRTKSFNPIGGFKVDTIDKVFDFAYNMTFGGEGEHKSKRSGGKMDRSQAKRFANTFQGKLAEFATCNIFWKYFRIKLPNPDLATYGLGKWDRFDFKYEDRVISVKSTKHFGNLLLLETEDWGADGEYIPNKQLYGSGKCDFTILIRMKPNSEKILSSMTVSESNTDFKETLYNEIKEKEWEYDVVGYITHDELVHIIKNKYIIKQGSLLNGGKPMDAENYYVQAGDMHDITLLKDKLTREG